MARKNIHSADSFCALVIPQCELQRGEASHYRVYQTGGDFSTVKAETASSALVASGFTHCSRVVRERLDADIIIAAHALVRSIPPLHAR